MVPRSGGRRGADRGARLAGAHHAQPTARAQRAHHRDAGASSPRPSRALRARRRLLRRHPVGEREGVLGRRRRARDGALGTRGPRARAAAFADEYALNWLHECFSKPTISLIDGPVMGRAWASACSARIASPARSYRFAMPETAIGLFPDVGAAWPLSRLPDSIGMYLGLTGRSIGPADAYALGLLTHCIPAARFEEIKAALADTWPVDTGARRAPGRSRPGRARAATPSTSSAASRRRRVEEIIARLQARDGSGARLGARASSPISARARRISLKVTHRHIRDARALDLRQTLSVDYRLACRFLDGHDFYEGVRAALIDKDGKPQWQPGAARGGHAGDGRRLFRAYGSCRAGAADARRNAGSARVIGSLERAPLW